MLIKNFEQLATSGLRKQALHILDAGLRAINTGHAVAQAVQYNAKQQILTVQGQAYELWDKQRVVVVGVGKAAFEAVSALYSIAGERIDCGYVLDLKGGSRGNLTCTIGTHPFPTVVNVQATKQILEVVRSLGERDILICVVSGGGSSLFCYPYEISCEIETQIVQTLMRAGATIQELNTVRKHISMVKGGQLAAAAYPAQVINLIFSDVPGDDLTQVASGPTLRDATTVHDAAAIIDKYNVLELCNMASCNLRETPKDDKYFEKVSTHLLVSGLHALRAMQEKAADLGILARIYKEGYSRRVEVLAKEFTSAVKEGECIIASGESTVQFQGSVGKGGRNLEMALAALPYVGEDQLFLAVDTDGADNTSYAGALVDASTKAKAERMHVSPLAELQSHSSYNFFEAVEDYIDTGLTGANVADIIISIKGN